MSRQFLSTLKLTVSKRVLLIFFVFVFLETIKKCSNYSVIRPGSQQIVRLSSRKPKTPVIVLNKKFNNFMRLTSLKTPLHCFKDFTYIHLLKKSTSRTTNQFKYNLVIINFKFIIEVMYCFKFVSKKRCKLKIQQN